MNTVRTIVVLIALLAPSLCFADLGDKVTKLTEPNNWLKEAALKTGYAASICTYQVLNGMTEGYHFSQETQHIITEENYHFYKTIRDVSGITTGWFAYGMIRDSRAGWLTKGRRIVGGALIARNAFEWGYKAQRYANPFDYTKAHNEHAVVYFGIRSGGVVDLYIGTGPYSGPIVDIACLVVGMLLLK